MCFQGCIYPSRFPQFLIERQCLEESVIKSIRSFRADEPILPGINMNIRIVHLVQEKKRTLTGLQVEVVPPTRDGHH